MIMSVPVQTAVSRNLGVNAVAAVGFHEFEEGS
jgi:hypothetical protein